MNYLNELLLSKLVAYLAHPYVDLPIEINKLKFSSAEETQIFDRSKSNKVLLRYIKYEEYKKFLIKYGIVSELVKRRIMFRTEYNNALSLKQELLEVIEKFNEQSIDTMFIKSLNSLPLDSDNFDIIVKDKDLLASIKLLESLGFVEIPWVREPYKWLFRYVSGGKDYLAIHLHTAVAWEGIKFIDVDHLLKGRRTLKIDGIDVGVPSQEDHLLITLAHAFFENHSFSLNDLLCVVEDLFSKEIDWDYVTNSIIEYCWFNPFYAMLILTNHVYQNLFGTELIPKIVFEKLDVANNRNRNLPEKLINQYNAKPSLPIKLPLISVADQYLRRIVSDNNISSKKKIGTILLITKGFLNRRLPFRQDRPAFIVFFVGQDGTGKTIHARYVWKELKKRKISVKYFWSRGMGLFFGPFLTLFRFMLLNSETRKVNKTQNEAAKILKREPLKTIWSFILLMDHLTKMMKIKLAMEFGNMVVCDRSIFDTFIDVKCDLGKTFSEVFERTVERLVPKPEIIFMMDAETRELAKRRPKMKLSLIEKKRSAYFNYLHTKDGLYVINTSDDLQKNREKILSKTLITLYSYHK